MSPCPPVPNSFVSQTTFISPQGQRPLRVYCRPILSLTCGDPVCPQKAVSHGNVTRGALGAGDRDPVEGQAGPGADLCVCRTLAPWGDMV